MRNDAPIDLAVRTRRASLEKVDPAPSASSSSRARGAGLILIVDDAIDAREIYPAYLRHAGFTVLVASDGEAGIELAASALPDAIVMDLAMPRLNGITAADRLKRDDRTRRIPIILLTAYPSDSVEVRANRVGVDLILTKPCLPRDLILGCRTVSDCIRQQYAKLHHLTRERGTG